MASNNPLTQNELRENTMHLNQLVDSFKKSKLATTSNETVRFYESHLNSVLEFFNKEELEDLEDITSDLVYDYLLEMKANGLAYKTRLFRLGIVKQLIKLKKRPYQYTQEQAMIMDIVLAKEDSEHYPALNKKQFKAFADYVMNIDEKDVHQFKRKIAMLLSIGSGARNSEIRHIRVKDIDFDNKRILLSHTKTKVSRSILLTDDTARLVRRYIEVAKPKVYLIENETNNGLIGRQMIQKYYWQVSEKLGFTVCTHILRATFITMMIADGTAIPYVMEIVGHKHLSTTERYIHLVDEDIVEQYEIHNPLAQIERSGWKPAEKVNDLLESLKVDSQTFEA